MSDGTSSDVTEPEGIDLIRVLIVDDEPDLRILLRLQLGFEQGFEVVGEAADGREAIERCAELEPDVVVMDLLMPRMTGFEATARLREEQPGVGVVAYSAVAGDFARDEMERLGVELVLKSGEVEPIAAALRRCHARRVS
jgi:two-component system, NarL family, nitrate/nitrite response regulator NarL